MFVALNDICHLTSRPHSRPGGLHVISQVLLIPSLQTVYGNLPVIAKDIEIQEGGLLGQSDSRWQCWEFDVTHWHARPLRDPLWDFVESTGLLRC